MDRKRFALMALGGGLAYGIGFTLLMPLEELSPLFITARVVQGVLFGVAIAASTEWSQRRFYRREGVTDADEQQALIRAERTGDLPQDRSLDPVLRRLLDRRAANVRREPWIVSVLLGLFVVGLLVAAVALGQPRLFVASAGFALLGVTAVVASFATIRRFDRLGAALDRREPVAGH
jgi:hypothetical protein